MKKVAVILLMASSLVMAGMAEAAKPRKRTRNANRVGAYGSAMVGLTTYSGDHSQNEEELTSSLVNSGFPSQGVTASTEETDFGYQAAFGYRFNRYFAAEISLAQFGDLRSTASGELDFGEGFVPTALHLTFSVGGPLISGVAILPINDRFELFGRAGVLFGTSQLEVSSRIDGETGGFGSAKGDSTNVVFGLGGAWNINQLYSVRLEYLHLGKVGESNGSGREELNSINIGMMIRF